MKSSGEKLQNQFQRLSSLEQDILTVLSVKSMYGLEMTNAIEVASQKRCKILIGSLYPTLHRMENKFLILSGCEDKTRESNKTNREYYKIPPLGERVLRKTVEYRVRLRNFKADLYAGSHYN